MRARVGPRGASHLPPAGTVIKKVDRDGKVRCECTVTKDGAVYKGKLAAGGLGIIMVLATAFHLAHGEAPQSVLTIALGGLVALSRLRAGAQSADYATDVALRTRLTLVHGSRSPEEIAFRDDIEALARPTRTSRSCTR
jgi:hypothetical protein